MPTIIPTTPQEVRFSLYSYAGTPTARYIATPTTLPTPAVSSTVGHHVMIVDRSGSMWGSPIQEAKAMLEKACTLEAVRQAVFHNVDVALAARRAAIREAAALVACFDGLSDQPVTATAAHPTV